MKTFSKAALVFIFIGMVIYGVSLFIEHFSDSLGLLAFVFMLLGAIMGFSAVYKQEKGFLKYIPIGSFFLFLFVITWYAPFSLLRILTWLKNSM